MKKLFLFYILSIIIAPIIFFIYYNLDLVCEPRAYIFEIITGGISLGLFFLAYKFKKIILFGITAIVPIYVIIIAPITMVKKLGAEKWLNERLIAFYTFELFAIMQLIIISIFIGLIIKNRSIVKINNK